MIKLSAIADLTFEFLFLILVIGALLTWIPRMPLHKPPFSFFTAICDFFFYPFRKIIPPIGGIDFSPILAFIVLGFIGRIVVEVLMNYNL